MCGSIRVVNKRWDANIKAEENEVVIDIDRPSRSPLQNIHPITRKNDPDDRRRVIALNKADVDADILIKGPRYQELKRIASLLAEGNDVALQCWCAPQPCHGDDYIPILRGMVQSIEAVNLQSPTDQPSGMALS